MNGIEINDELIGCYIEGVCTSIERDLVRDYLVKNPEEYERIICLMDSHREFQLNPDSPVLQNEESENYLDFSFASAAFIPFKRTRVAPRGKDYVSSTYMNLNNLLDEVNAI